MTDILNVLASRYASIDMEQIWAQNAIVAQERLLWAHALDVQMELGVETSEGAIACYHAVITDIDLQSIAKREAKMQHDVMARKTEFDALASEKYGADLSLAHRGFTSRDATENCEQLRIFQSLKLTRDRCVAVLARLNKKAQEYKSVDVSGRSHRQPGQVTTYGKRLATIAEEFLVAFAALEYLIENYKFRGFKGAMGTGQDLTDLLGNQKNLIEFENMLCEKLGIEHVLISTGQIYPRSLDFQMISILYQLSAAPGNFSRLLRDTAELRHLSEGFAPGRKGSSAMPHKQNPSKSERIASLRGALSGHLGTAMTLVGVQEYEGDVSCSVSRRVMLGDSFFAIDGILETMMTVLDQMTINPKVIQGELDAELPFLSTTAIRGALREQGMDDTEAYNIIQEHSKAASTDIAEGLSNSLLQRLADDNDVPLDLAQLKELCAPNHGAAGIQTDEVCGEIEKVLSRFSEEVVGYSPQTRN